MVAALKSVYERFIRIRGTPREIALGFALGIFIGFSPTMGLQMALGFFLASLLKWNKYAAAIGVWISNPLTAPFLYGATYIVGSKLLRISNSFNLSADILDWNTLIGIIQKSPGILVCLLVGGLVVGIFAAIVGYFISSYWSYLHKSCIVITRCIDR